MPVKVRNWKRDIKYTATSVEVVKSVDEIVSIVKDTAKYPSPVRVKGSHHSTTKCIVAEGGTVIDIMQMNKILKIDKENKTITMQPGVFHIDAAKELAKDGLQFYANPEIGNMTVGSGATCATKDASFFNKEKEYEYGQVSSYCIGMKLVGYDGKIIEVDEEKDKKLMEMLRGSYGMLGVVYEVTYRVKEAKPIEVHHTSYTLDEFAENLDKLIDESGKSIMLYLFPFRDRIVAEYRSEGDPNAKLTTWQWRLRNWVWKTASPAVGKIATAIIPFKRLRSRILDFYNKLSQKVMTKVLRGKNTSAADQIIRFPKTAGFASFTFSIFAFSRSAYAQTIRDYFQFCKDYFKENDYRCELLSLGYLVREDCQSIFSYTRDGPALTIDPSSTGAKGWQGFIIAFNEFSIQHDGKPLFNQTGRLTPLQAKAAFGKEIEEFQEVRRKYDPNDRFYTPFFKKLFE